MASNRNARRKAAKARLLAKQERIARAELGRIADAVRATVAANLSKPIERDFPIRSCLADMKAQSHRAYICRAGGSMERRRAMALKAKGGW